MKINFEEVNTKWKRNICTGSKYTANGMDWQIKLPIFFCCCW